MSGKGKRAAAGLVLLAAGFWRLPVAGFRDPFSPAVFDRDGRLLNAEPAEDGQWRLKLEAVPPRFERALLTAEDRRFYHHFGVDPFAFSRALFQLAKERRVRSGASTITMQVVRLSRRDPPRTVSEKLIEAALALRLERSRSKKAILALYAQHAPFGGNVVGLESASWRYFGRAPEHLSWSESCALAVLPNQPSLVRPGRGRAELKRKRDRLLAALRASGALSELELRLALREPLPTEHPMPRRLPHLAESLPRLRPDPSRRWKTTLSAALQGDVQSIVTSRSEALSQHGVRNAAVLVIDNADFSVAAYVGNSRLDDWSRSGRAVDIVQRPRSTGSVLKPFLYASALQAGEISPASLLPDVPTRYDGFSPENYDRKYRGAVPARAALAQSLNVPAVQLLREHGVAPFYETLKGLGMSTLFRPPDDYGLALILGDAEGTLWDLTRMYAHLAELASGRQARGVDNVRLLASDRRRRLHAAEFGPGAAWLTLDMLTEVSRPDEDVHWRSFASSRRIAWKTGTSVGHRDGWALGTNGRYTVGVWTGNASGEGRPEITGTTSAAPILFEIFSRLGPGRWPQRPEYDLKDVAVCKDGYLPVDGCPTQIVSVPARAPFERTSPYFHVVHLDASGTRQVTSDCERPEAMRHETWFTLAPNQEYYYRPTDPFYRPLPPFKAGCRDAGDEKLPMAFIYPHEGSRIYIPIDLAEHKGRTVFQAVHRRQGARLYWHLDDEYLGETRDFHQWELDIPPGSHVVTIVDDAGRSLSRHFEVLETGLSENSKASPVSLIP